LNLPNEDIKEAAIASIKGNEAMYTSSDVGKYFNRETGILDPEMYDYNSLMGVDFFPFDGCDSGFFDVLVRQVQVYPVDTFNRVPVVLNIIYFIIFPGRVVHDHDVILRV